MSLRKIVLLLFKFTRPNGLALLLCLTCHVAHSQGLGMPPSKAMRPQTSAPHGNNLKGGRGTDRETSHRDALGNRCLAVQPLARPRVANPSVYDHVLALDNQCLQTIKARACYTASDQCVEADVPGLTRKDVLLGISSAIKYFSYELREF
jgi:hypothetical protein